MPLITDIQAAAIAEKQDISRLLRMCKLLAARISHAELEAWVEYELNGYPSIDMLPNYRKFKVNSYGSFYGASLSAPRLQIPLSVLPDQYRQTFDYVFLRMGVGAYAALLSCNEAASIQEPWPVEVAHCYASQLTPRMQCIAAWKEIPVAGIVHMLDSIQTRILGFVIDLEKVAPEAGDLPIGSQPPLGKDKMTQIFNTNITGNVGNISNASSDFAQNAVLNGAGDRVLLEQGLKELGFSSSDVDEVREALADVLSAGVKEDKEEAVKHWALRMASKCVDGVAGVSVEGLAAGVVKVLALYLGIPVG